MPRSLSSSARVKMLDAARQLLAERGLDACTVDAVAAESGVAKTTIYRHFDSANELLLAAIGEIIEPIPNVETADPVDDVLTIVESFVEMASQPGVHQLLTAVMHRAATDDDFDRLHAELVTERKQPLRLALQRCLAAGLIDPSIDLDIVALMLEGPIVARVMHDHGRFHQGEIEQILRLVLRGVERRPALG